MDIDFLLWLQGIRETSGGTLTAFFDWISDFAVTYLPFMGAMLYWCVSKKWGYASMINLFGSGMLNYAAKNTFCVYRPYVRDAHIVPVKTSSSYSFPSAHTQYATGVLGTVAVWQWKTKKWLSALCGIFIAAVGFSRNWAGVHTPQDVFFGFLFAAIIIFLNGKVFDYVEKHPEKKDIFLLIGLCLTMAVLLYVCVKPYPTDLGADGELLVKPSKAKLEVFQGAGLMAGVLMAGFLDGHWIKYEVPKGILYRVVMGAAGLWISWYLFRHLGLWIVPAMGAEWGGFTACILVSLFMMAVWPGVIKLFGNIADGG